MMVFEIAFFFWSFSKKKRQRIYRAGPPYMQVKHLLEALKKLKKLTIKKSPKFKKKNTADPNLKEFWNKEKRKILEIKWFQFSF